MKIRIVIPSIFISVNQQYLRADHRTALTRKAKEYRDLVMWSAKAKYRGEPIKKPVRIDIWYYFPNHRRRDILNDKITYDALEGIIYADDSQIVEIHAYKRFSKNQRIELIVSDEIDENE